MTGVYDLKGINEQLENELDEAKTLLKAWQNVTYPTKKNGEPFAIMSKNFDGATYTRRAYSYYGYENELKVHAYGKRYYSDWFDCFTNVRYTDKEKITKPENLIDKDTYIYDLDDIKTMVQRKIEHLKNRISDLEKDINNSKEVYNAFLESFQSAIQKLKDDTNDSALFSLVRDTVIEHNKYKYN